jgi:magnesium transporter
VRRYQNPGRYTPGAMADASSPSSLDIVLRRPNGRVETVEAARLGDLGDLVAASDTIACVRVRNPSDSVIGDLQREFGLHPLAVEDLRKRHQRPKIDPYGDQHMVVVYEALEADDAGSGLSEVHIFVSRSWVVTVDWERAPMVEAVHDRLARHPGSIGDTPGEVLYALLDAAVDSYFPELDRLSDRIDALEDRVLETDPSREDLREILAIKRRLLDLRRVLAPTRDVANVLLRRESELVGAGIAPYFQDLYDHTVRVLDQLDVYRDLLATVLEARLTVASNSLNAVMKRLTALTVVIMIPTLIAGIYGMNFDVMPELDWGLGYPFALALMAAAALLAIAFFRAREWF